MITWLKKNRLLIAVLSVIGSAAGLGFSITDLHGELQKKKKLTKRS